MSTAALYRAVRLTARSSALFFAPAQAIQALRPTAVGAWRSLYLGFMAAHATHFAVVAQYARVTGGRALFPRGRNLNDVGGWHTVAAIYTLSQVLPLLVGGGAFPATRGGLRLAGRVATGIIGAMFVGTYAGQLSVSLVCRTSAHRWRGGYCELSWGNSPIRRFCKMGS